MECGANRQALSDVVSAPSQFAGFQGGKSKIQSGVDLAQGQRNCQRLQTAGSAIADLTNNPGDIIPNVDYMCAVKHCGRPLTSSDIQINGNVFSTTDLKCN
jgi:hypothetical protein